MAKRITKCPGATTDPSPRVCDLPAGHAERGQPWCLDIRGQRFVRDSLPARARQDTEQLAAYWLYLGNRAKERGQLALAERHYARAQRHHDEMNRSLGNGDGS